MSFQRVDSLQLSLLVDEQLPPLAPPTCTLSIGNIVLPKWCTTQDKTKKAQFYDVSTGKIFDISSEEYYQVGRNEKSYIVIPNILVSRCHALLMHHISGEWYLMDMNSANGTYVGDCRIAPYTPTLIKKNSIIRFGSLFEQQFMCLTGESCIQNETSAAPCAVVIKNPCDIIESNNGLLKAKKALEGGGCQSPSMLSKHCDISAVDFMKCSIGRRKTRDLANLGPKRVKFTDIMV